ncbi:hypothetical protein M2390_002603 [Mycetocola sp. BIGb0189]|uniref:hypothetical protein n=1 Tax=Mycetocola sp. BIGb0189 TaxID=2940604 RepID=UPI002167EE6A|nr:hypothetical protein [Mycetocola sp. BIGb0189]MCS4277397.1 hypothetical protein [Mycetocola sp. BIGb0189]
MAKTARKNDTVRAWNTDTLGTVIRSSDAGLTVAWDHAPNTPHGFSHREFENVGRVVDRAEFARR